MILLLWLIQCLLGLPFFITGFLFQAAIGAFQAGRNFSKFIDIWMEKK